MTKFLIFTNGRSGSNYLSNMLNLNNESVCYGEILGSWNLSYKLYGWYYLKNNKVEDYINLFFKSNFLFYMAQLYSAYSHLKGNRNILLKRKSKIKALGIKDFLVTIKNNNALDFFIKNEEFKIIYLYRDNILERYVSGLFMKQNKVSSSYKKVNFKKLILMR